MCQGDRIARLQCLCIYHKHCLDEWFQRNRCCPEHPDQAPQEYIETLPRNTAIARNRLPINTTETTTTTTDDHSPNTSASVTLDDEDDDEDNDDEDALPALVTNSLPVELSISHLPSTSPILVLGSDHEEPSSSATHTDHVFDATTLSQTPDY